MMIQIFEIWIKGRRTTRFRPKYNFTNPKILGLTINSSKKFKMTIFSNLTVLVMIVIEKDNVGPVGIEPTLET